MNWQRFGFFCSLSIIGIKIDFLWDNLIFDGHIQFLKKDNHLMRLKNFIKSIFIDDMNDIDYLCNVRSFTGSKPLNIFSTNYDLTIEKLCF